MGRALDSRRREVLGVGAGLGAGEGSAGGVGAGGVRGAWSED